MNDKDQNERWKRIDAYLEEFAKGMVTLRASQDRTDAAILELKASQDRTDAQLKKTIKKLDDIGRQLGDLGLVQGEVAEDLFYRNVGGMFRRMDVPVERVRRNVKIKGLGEYDIVVEARERVVVIEVKNKLSKRMVDRFLERELSRFKTLLPQYRDRKLYGGIGSLVVQDTVGRYAEKSGLFVLTQSDDGGAALMNRKGFKPREFD
jgi:hypothetical protein